LKSLRPYLPYANDERVNQGSFLIGWRVLSRNYTAAVMTQLSDVEGELNGFVTYDRRKIKVDVAKLSSLNKKLLT